MIIVDCGAQSAKKIQRTLQTLGHQSTISGDPDEIAAAERIIICGEGDFAAFSRRIARAGLLDAVKQAAANKPFLAVGLAMQVLFEASEEGEGMPGLELFPGQVVQLAEKNESGEVNRLTHIGWSEVFFTRPHPAILGISNRSTFYFHHSFIARPQNRNIVLGLTEFKGERLPVMLADGNLLAVQFHPELSSQQGMMLLDQFMHWKP